MAKYSKRNQRQRGQPDPIAQRISSNLEANVDDGDAVGEVNDGTNADGTPRYTVNPQDVDLSAGGEFLEARPNDTAVDK